ncbi:MAG: hypothetical protein J6A05_08715, partial [Oscillospiraceae bacterium]|nr:hypothetical protein [Oscillospiraceae bacterium]
MKGFIDRKEYENAQNLLADCQDTAIQIGNLIEESEGEGFVTVSFLEEYCEALYEVATNLPEISNGYKVQKQLDKKIIKAENSAKNDIKVKLEVVFFPYKASMWDSLESVWKAADEDPECDAYVVPIPYYDRKPGGAFGEFHYEGGEYPDYVPVVHYEAYNLEQRCPDVIYVHNPYDGNNYVTSVDPRYYSFILKQYTECLVYVPYYSTSGGMSEMQRFIPSYNFFDYIVIQSKKHREYFEKSLPDSKFLAMGSPKFDRTINMCKNPPEAPAEWKKLMEGKKVYFYNTSLNGMLADTEAFMKKMKYVFETFSKHKDACILWRPHPLFESTIDSMRPQYKNVFNSLKNYFIDNKLGIYDDTPDITESIALSDAYIGDAGSSVTSLFGIAGKPLFILNNRIHTEPTDDDKIAQNIVSFNNEWLITPTGNRLFHAENKDYKFKYFCTLSDSEATTYFIPLNINGKTYVFPKDTGDILIFNGKEIIKRIPIDKNTELSNAFANQVLCGKYLYLIPYMYQAIVRFNIETEKIEYLSENIDVIVGIKDEQRYVGGLREYNGKIYICSPVDNRILIINGET